jgi:predicted O-methyltransferase YrrM
MNKIDGMLLPDECAYLARLAQMTDREIIIEVGSFPGQSTQIFEEHFNRLIVIEPQLAEQDKFNWWCKHHDINKTAYMPFLSYQTPTYVNVKDDMDRLIRTVKLLPIVSMVFIDGDHSGLGVTYDAGLLMQHVKTGGIIAFHDYNWQPWMQPWLARSWPEIKPAIDRIFELNQNWERIEEEKPGSIVAYRRV